MHFHQVLARLALLGTAAAAATLPAVDGTAEMFDIEGRAVQCRGPGGGVHVIAAGGANQTNPSNYGLVSSLVYDIVHKIPGSNSYSVPYNKTLPLSPNSIPDGTYVFVSYINTYVKQCPQDKIALVGYSEGAVVILRGICGPGVKQSLASTNIVGVVVYGDGSREAGAPYNLGTCTSGNGSKPRDPKTCGVYAYEMQSYCDVGDPVCCQPGNQPAVHKTYPKYDQQATAFIASRYDRCAKREASAHHEGFAGHEWH